MTLKMHQDAIQEGKIQNFNERVVTADQKKTKSGINFGFTTHFSTVFSG